MVIRAVVVVVPVVVITAIVGLVVIIVIVGVVVVVVVVVVRCCGSCSSNYSTNHVNIIGITRKRVLNDNTNTDGCCFKCQRKTLIFGPVLSSFYQNIPQHLPHKSRGRYENMN